MYFEIHKLYHSNQELMRSSIVS